MKLVQYVAAKIVRELTGLPDAGYYEHSVWPETK
jgi:hypothetical protein